MSRAKQRKKQRKKEQSGQSPLFVGGGLLAIIIVAIGFFVFQGGSGSQSAPVVGEEGRLIWQTMELRDARTGEAFTLADFDEGDVVVKIMSPF